MLVINDTIVTSALAVARAKLDGFVAPSNNIINPDFYEPLTFSELVDKGYIQKHQITRQNTEGLPREVVRAVDDIQSEFALDGDIIAEHYYAFLSLPVVGKNLLDEEEFARLQENLNPGEMALMVLNTKGFSFISDEFIPQTLSLIHI